MVQEYVNGNKQEKIINYGYHNYVEMDFINLDLVIKIVCFQQLNIKIQMMVVIYKYVVIKIHLCIGEYKDYYLDL